MTGNLENTAHYVKQQGPQSCWQQGANAARAGKKLEENPYFHPHRTNGFRNYALEDKYRSWKNGWQFVSSQLGKAVEPAATAASLGVVLHPKHESTETHLQSQLWFGKGGR